VSAAALCQASAAYALDALARVSVADLGRPTPCPGWDLRTLLLHVADAVNGLSGASGSTASGPVSAARVGIEELLEAVRGATSDDAAYGGAIELATHGWDIHVTLGTGLLVPEDYASAVLDLATALVSDEVRSRFFGPVVGIEPRAPAADRLIAFMGRNPDWCKIP